MECCRKSVFTVWRIIENRLDVNKEFPKIMYLVSKQGMERAADLDEKGARKISKWSFVSVCVVIFLVLMMRDILCSLGNLNDYY